tara:strand:- start:812 stop:1195 length:384 start_codon:yes stop_codon:yes gene_type:complete
MYCVYILKNKNKSYIGMTNDFLNRWEQHNCYKKGGAKYTTGNLQNNCWEPICIIDGFKNKSEAMQCEWKCKRAHGYLNRVKNVSHLIEHSEKWTKNSPVIKDQNLKVYLRNEFKKYFEIETRELSWF